METRTCTKCKQDLPATLNYFYKNSAVKIGLGSQCKDCVRVQKGAEKRITIINGDKRCSRCKQWFPADSKYFHRNNQSITGFVPECKDCIREKYGNKKRVVVLKGDEKRCAKCKEYLPLTIQYFNKSINDRTGFNPYCKNCLITYRKNRYDPEYQKYREKFYERSPISIRVKDSRRRATKLQAVPKWIDTVKVKKIYSQAIKLTKETGIPYDVDHIDPLRNPLVCGLHVHQNLQVLTESENCKKSNKFTPYGVDSTGKQYRLRFLPLQLEFMIEQFKKLDPLGLYYLPD